MQETERTPEYARFRDALLDFSVDPSPSNLVRYLAASRALDERRVARPSPPARRAALTRAA